MKEPKRYYCGNGEGMFEDDKNGHWVEYSEHKAIVETLTEQLRKHAVSGSLPSLDDATKVAVRISEEAITPPLDAKEQAMFIAGFQECIKWLNVVFGNDR